MNFFSVIEEKWIMLCDKTRPARQRMGSAAKKTGSVLHVIGGYLYRMRAVFLAVPVAIAAVWLAILNMARLPDEVGIDLQTSGGFSMMIPKGLAVIAPLAVTALCILMILCSKKVAYPWLISIFTLVLPVLIYVTNAYPA
ncbi:MAG: hypothetical protein IJW45_01600 [Oscillospiraceae bacterium]|nr:hypothetical protein [Oscillospiraceae bacterium]